MEKTKHIKNITIENFKCFDQFSVGEFGIYNIILGDNNVGKTSFLESLLFDENISNTIENFQNCLLYKNIISDNFLADKSNPFFYFKNRYSEKSVIDVKIEYIDFIIKMMFETVKNEDIKLKERKSFNKSFNTHTIDDEYLRVIRNNEILFRKFNTLENFETTLDFIPYVVSNNYYSNDLVEFYLENFADSKEKRLELISNVKFILPNIQDIEITINPIDKKPLIGIWLTDKDAMLSLPMFGDGTIRLFRIALEIVMCKDKYICIDEIDTGIHYTKYKEFIKTILKIARTNNVQLFISTHNNEFLKSFKEVLEEKDFINYQVDTKSFTLKRLPDESIKAYRYNFEEFEFAIEQENELR